MKNEVKNITANQTPIEIALGIDKNGMTTARKLYDFLELSKGQFSRWAKTNITENQFATEQEDYWGFDINVEGNITQDFKLTASFAKKLSMLQKNERGEQARNYFIKVEDKLKEVAKEEQKYIREVSFKEQVESIAAIAEMLHVNDAGKITMLDKLYKSYQLPTDFLPQYELNGNHELKSLTALIKCYGYKTTATKLNKLFLQAGILEEHSRDTSNRKKHPNGKKPFKVLTEKREEVWRKCYQSEKHSGNTAPLLCRYFRGIISFRNAGGIIMDAKLSNLSELLYNIQHTQEKMQLQITELLQEYFCYLDPEEGHLCGGYKKAMLNCNIAEDYSNYISDTLEEAREAIEELIQENADRQKVSA